MYSTDAVQTIFIKLLVIVLVAIYGVTLYPFSSNNISYINHFHLTLNNKEVQSNDNSFFS